MKRDSLSLRFNWPRKIYGYCVFLMSTFIKEIHYQKKTKPFIEIGLFVDGYEFGSRLKLRINYVRIAKLTKVHQIMISSVIEAENQTFEWKSTLTVSSA